jgi:GTP-binding protein
VHLVEPFPTDGSDPLANYQAIRKELELYSKELAAKPEIVAISKSELTGSGEIRERLEKELGRPVLTVSAVTGEGLTRLVAEVLKLLANAPKIPAPVPTVGNLFPEMVPPTP